MNLSVKRSAYWVLLLTLSAAALRLTGLESGLWHDEIATLVRSVRNPLFDIVTSFPDNNNHLLYSVLGRLSITILGEHAWSLRLPAAIFGIATIPLFYIFSASITSRIEALAATCILTFSYHHIWFSQNARGYTALLFFTVLASHLLLKGLDKGDRNFFVAYGVAAALGVYMHLTMAIVVLSHATIVSWYLIDRANGLPKPSDIINPAVGFLVAGLLILLLYAPLVNDVQTFFVEEQVADSERVATVSWAFLETLRGLQIGYGIGSGVFLGAIVMIVGSWCYYRESRLICMLFLLPGPMVLAATILMNRPVFPRFFFMLMGFALLIGVRGVSALCGWAGNNLGKHDAGKFSQVSSTVLFAIVMTASLVALPSNYRYPKQNYADPLTFIESTAETDHATILAGWATAFPYQEYFKRPWQLVNDVNEFRDVARSNTIVWVLYTFPHYLEKDKPDLWSTLLSECSRERVYPGTVAGGDIVVLRCPSS